MPPTMQRSAARRLPFLVGILILAVTPAAHAVRIVNYNFTNYPGNNSGLRNPKFRTILAPIGADVLVTQEITSQTGVDSILNRVLNRNEPGQWAAAPFINGNDTDNALFYKTSKFTLITPVLFFYPNPANQLRLVCHYRLKPVGYTSDAAILHIYSQHLKASPGFESQREQEAIGIRNDMNALPAGSQAILCGDFNIYTSTEPAFQTFLASQADNDGRLYDPLNAVGTWNNTIFATIHTQCPFLNNCPSGFGFSGGGLDDRFDMFLPTYTLNDSEGLDLLVSTYKPVGNDGQHYNKDINVAPVIPEGQAYADALVYASDHLPTRVDVQLPAKIGVASALAFGSVIVGASASQPLSISNPASVPADELNYSFSADPGFTAPAGGFILNAGSAPVSHSIGMSTGTAGFKSGTLRVNSDDPDHATSDVSLTGTVLRHAAASFDSMNAVVATSVDFGYHAADGFTDQSVRVHNFGYDNLQARLSVNGGTITGGAGRFTIAGGFTPALLSNVGKSYAIHFEAAGATTDSIYNATLTFTSTDEALPGAQPQPNLVVSLQARVQPATDATESESITVTRLYAPFPNPPVHGTTIRFDLVRDAAVRLEVFDVAGRRVATLADGGLARGAHRVQWDGRSDAGATLGSGVYFLRLRGPQLPTQTVRLTFVR